MRDLCYSTDFEERIAGALEAAGCTVYRSIYASYGDQVSQIDLVVFDGGMPVCIECKAYDAVRYMYKRSSEWSYLGCDNVVRSINNPIKQVKRQADNLYMDMLSIEATLPDRLTIPHSLCAVMLKGDVRDYSSEHVYTERSMDKLLKFCTCPSFLDARVADAMHKWFKEHSDTSSERLKEHSRYLRDCKRNKTGAFTQVE